MRKVVKPHTFVPFMPEDPVPLPSGPVPMVICTVCGWKQLDPTIKAITSKARKACIKRWHFDCTDCDDVARAKAEGLPGVQPPGRLQ
jgi:hypothetical protein